MTIEMRGEASVHIDASAEEVYELVTDVTRMGEWSPECIGARWVDGCDGPIVGAQFMGTNKRADNEWTTPNTVMVADPGKEFAWVVGTNDTQVTWWRFVFTSSNGGTDVTESFELGEANIGFRDMVNNAPEDEQKVMVDARRVQLLEDIRHTLERIKERAEAS